MKFENLSIDIDLLPQTETVELKPLHSEYLDVSMTASLLQVIVFWAGGIVGVSIMGWWTSPMILLLTGGGLLLLSVLALLLTRYGFKVKGYALRQHDIIYRSGLIFRNETTVPFDRVQHCEVSQGPVEKLFGLSSLKVYTAGGQGSDLVVPGLSPEEARRMKALILKKEASDEPAF